MPSKRKAPRPHKTGSVRPKGRNWEGRFRINGSEPKYVPLGVRKDVDPKHGITESEALEKLAKHQQTYEAPVKTEKITFKDFCPRFVAYKKEEKKRATTTMTAIDVAIRCHLEPEFGDRYLADITEDDVERWMRKELKTAAPKSVKNWRSVFHSILDYAVKKRVITENVVALTEAPEVTKNEKLDVMNWTDITAVRDACLDTAMGRLLKLIILVACRCGLRESEIIALKWSEIQWETGWIRVIEGHVRGETKLPKGKKGRITPMPKIVKVALYAWFKTTKFNQPGDLVFGHPVDGSELNASALNERFKEAVVAAGIRPTELRKYKKRNGEYELRDYVELSFHDCRHAFASWALSNGQAPASVQKWGGWENVKTMEIYDHFIPTGFEVDALNAAIERESAPV
ncbi:MAG: site-specific integrase [Actinobacteria bacterium]|nr:site-specific integrase [Actinomycetota bacterium]